MSSKKCLTRVSSKKCQVGASSETVLQECQVRVSQKSVKDILELGMLQKGKKQLPQTSFFLPMGRVLPSMTKQTSLNQTIERDSLYNGCLLPLNRREPRKW